MVLDFDSKLQATTTFEDLLEVIRANPELRQALVRALAEEHPVEFVQHIAVYVAPEHSTPTRFNLGKHER